MIPYRGLKSVTIKQSILWNPFKVNRKTIMSVNWEQSLLISEVEAGHRTIGRASEKRLSSYTRPAPKQQQWRTLWSIATWSTVSIQYSLMRRDATCKLQDIYPAVKNWQTAATHTHTCMFNGPLSGTIRVSRHQKGKTNLDFTEARDSEWQWRQLDHMQVCTSLQTDNHTSTPPLSFLTGSC